MRILINYCKRYYIINFDLYLESKKWKQCFTQIRVPYTLEQFSKITPNWFSVATQYNIWWANISSLYKWFVIHLLCRWTYFFPRKTVNVRMLFVQMQPGCKLYSIDALLCLLALFAESLMDAILRKEKRPYNSLAVDWPYTLCKLSMNCNAVCIIYLTEVKEIPSNINY